MQNFAFCSTFLVQKMGSCLAEGTVGEGLVGKGGNAKGINIRGAKGVEGVGNGEGVSPPQPTIRSPRN